MDKKIADLIRSAVSYYEGEGEPGVNMPALSDATVAALVEGCTEDRPSAVLHPGGQPGAPACFPASCFAALSALRGDRGAGALLGNAVTIPAPPAELADVDRPQDLSAG